MYTKSAVPHYIQAIHFVPEPGQQQMHINNKLCCNFVNTKKADRLYSTRVVTSSRVVVASDVFQQRG
jgi:hypothetical protein